MPTPFDLPLILLHISCFAPIIIVSLISASPPPDTGFGTRRPSPSTPPPPLSTCYHTFAPHALNLTFFSILAPFRVLSSLTFLPNYFFLPPLTFIIHHDHPYPSFHPFLPSRYSSTNLLFSASFSIFPPLYSTFVFQYCVDLCSFS